MVESLVLDGTEKMVRWKPKNSEMGEKQMGSAGYGMAGGAYIEQLCMLARGPDRTGRIEKNCN